MVPERSVQVLGRSEGFSKEWEGRALAISRQFGVQPSGISCPLALFATPFHPGMVAIVQVSDQGCLPESNLLLRYLLVPLGLYESLGCDPFRISAALPPVWNSSENLPDLSWPGEIETQIPQYQELQRTINVSYSATLLGGAQALVDGSRLVFERSEPAPTLVEGLWKLLPLSTRSHLWPATFAFGNDLGFDIAVVPRANEENFAGYLTEGMMGDYPEGNYELNLQVAIENGDQPELNRLFLRRNRQQTLELACWLLGVLVFGGLLSLLIAESRNHSSPRTIPKSISAPRPIQAPPLSLEQRTDMQQDLAPLCRRFRVDPPPDPSEGQLLLALERLDQKLEQLQFPHLKVPMDGAGQLSNLVLGLSGTHPLPRAFQLAFGPSGSSRDSGSLQNVLRTLIWKYGGSTIAPEESNASKLLEELEKTLIQNQQKQSL